MIPRISEDFNGFASWARQTAGEGCSPLHLYREMLEPQDDEEICPECGESLLECSCGDDMRSICCDAVPTDGVVYIDDVHMGFCGKCGHWRSHYRDEEIVEVEL